MKYKIPFTGWYLYKPENNKQRHARIKRNKKLCSCCGKIKQSNEYKTCEKCRQVRRAYNFNKKRQQINQTEYEQFKKEDKKLLG